MYAIIRAGGKQYTVTAGDTVRVEKMEKRLGEQFDLPEILMVGGAKNFIGAPLVQNAKVTVVVIRQAKAPKIIVFKKKRRQGYRRTQGHRQLFTELFVKSITTPEGETFASEQAARVIDPERTQARKEAAAEKHAATKKKAKAASPTDIPAAPKKAAKKKSAGKKVASKKPASKKPAGKKAAAKKTTKKST
jgi:large subunit ribosomal protein L21